MRAVEKQGDFLLLEADGDSGGGGSGKLGWADASCVVPTSFPALYEFASDLPDAVCGAWRGCGRGGGEVLSLTYYYSFWSLRWLSRSL